MHTDERLVPAVAALLGSQNAIAQEPLKIGMVIEQHVGAALRLSETAIVLEHGRVVHAGASAGLRDDRALLERLVTLRVD